MFDTVGRASSVGGRSSRRRLAALLLSVVFNGGAVGALTWIGGRAVDEVKEIGAAIERPIELVLPALGAPAPAAAPQKKARARAAASAAPAALPEIVPPTLVADPPPVDVPVVALGGDGVTDGALVGDGGGDGDGDGDDAGGGGGAGDGLGSGGGGVKIVHWSEAEVKVRADVRPSDYPAAASALKLPDTRCVVRILIDERGTPYDVVAKTCPEIFRASAENVAMRYRFYPVRDGGRAVRAGFDLTLHFRGE